MNWRIAVRIHVLLLTGFINQSLGQTPSNTKTEQLEKQVDSAFSEMLNYAERLDLKALSTGVDDRYEAGFISNGKYYSTYASLEDQIKT
jgi:hypothetical protein